MSKGTVCFIVKNNKILLTHIDYGKDGKKWNGIGGFIEKGETLEKGLAREFSEETYMTVNKNNLAHAAELNYGNFQLNVFLASDFSGEIKTKDQL